MNFSTYAPAALGHRVQESRSRGASLGISNPAFWIGLLVAHLPLALAIKTNSYVATAHALVTVAIGLHAVANFRTPDRVLCMMGYVAASEPLWRVGRAMIFYESGKYVLAGLAILALLKFRLLRRADKTPLIYFLLLLPSLFVLPEFDRRQISFNLSGPFALAMSTLTLSALPLPPRLLRKLFLTTLAPIVGFAFVATFSTVTAEEINFYTSKIAAGGLGNNQASSILGLGTLLAFLFISITRQGRLLRWLVAGLGVWCGIQGALTFSRGGVATAAGAIAAASFFLLRDRRSRGFLVIRIALIALIVVFLAVPLLNSVTMGQFEDRFTSDSLTGRDKIIEADMIAFRKHPFLGVGPGQSKVYHALTFRRSSSHTEYSRLLAEHGLLGLLALMLLAWMVIRRLLRSTSPVGKAMAAGFTVWTLLFMFHAAMRMAAASFVFSLGAAYLMAREPRTGPALPRPRLVRRRSPENTGGGASRPRGALTQRGA